MILTLLVLSILVLQVYLLTFATNAVTLLDVACTTVLLIVFSIFIWKKRNNDKVALKQNAEMELALKASGTSVWRYDVKKDEFQTVYGNPVCCDKMKLEDFLGKVHPQNTASVRNELLSLIKHQSESTCFTIRCVCDEMKSGYGFYRYNIIDEGTSEIKRNFLFGTERNVTEDKLNDSEYQNVLMSLNLSIKASNIKVWYYDVEEDIIYRWVDNEFEASGNLHDFIAQALPSSDRAEVLKLYQQLLDDRLGDYHSNVEMMATGDTEYRTYECSFMSIKDARGKVVKVTGTLQDITDKHNEHVLATESNERFTLAMKTSNFVLWEYDCASQLFTSFNEPLNHFDETVKLSIIDYIHYLHPDDVEKVVPINEHLIMRHDMNFSVDLRFKDSEDGEWQYYTFTGAPFERDNFGRVVKFAGVRKNNTHFIALNKELKRAKEKAERSDNLKTLFLANMTHEIRTPLNAIVGFSQLMQSTTDKEELNHYCKIINQNNDMLLTIFNDIIDLSRIEAGFIDFNCIDFDMTTQIDALRELYKPKIPEGVEFVIDNPYSSFDVCLDWNRLVQIYTNFVNNACKYTVTGTITIGYRADEKGIKIFCRDTGKGIAAEDQKRIFDSFEKVDSYIQGLGLGLSLCNAIVKAAKGEIGVQSELGVGSLFWAILPCKPRFKTKEKITMAI